jgi:hypothetical protein
MEGHQLLHQVTGGPSAFSSFPGLQKSLHDVLAAEMLIKNVFLVKTI